MALSKNMGVYRGRYACRPPRVPGRFLVSQNQVACHHYAIALHSQPNLGSIPRAWKPVVNELTPILPGLDHAVKDVRPTSNSE